MRGIDIPVKTNESEKHFDLIKYLQNYNRRKEGERGRGGQTGPWRASTSRAPQPVLLIQSW